MAKRENSETMLTVESAAKRLGIGRQTAYEGVRRGEIPSLKIGGRILIPRAALERLEGGGDTQSNAPK
jgi:excisionase family DNA binding protein